MKEYLMIITQSAAKQIQRLQTMKCFYFVHPLVQEWKSAEMGGILAVTVSGIENWKAGDTVCWHCKLPISQTEGSKHHLPICITE